MAAAPSQRPRVVVARGHLVTPWELRPWELLSDRYDVSYLVSERNRFDASSLDLEPVPVRTARDRIPSGRLAELVGALAGDRYLDLERHLAGVDVVHSEELSFWFAADAARAKRAPGSRFKLVQTVWETIPLLDTYRNRRARRARREVLAHTDRFLAATARARDALRLEGVPAERIEVCPPGIDLERFGAAAASEPSSGEHLVLSPGRLVWEKGHQDVIRAVAALRDGLVGEPLPAPRVLIVGQGPEEGRLRAYARELGLADRVEVAGAVPYEEMPGLYARASCLVLASLPMARGLHLLDVPRVFWEEQFGMVLAEAMAAGLEVLASTSGAIPEVLDDRGDFAAGDWLGLARQLADGPLARAPGARVEHPPELVERYSTAAAAERLAAAYGRVLGRS